MTRADRRRTVAELRAKLKALRGTPLRLIRCSGEELVLAFKARAAGLIEPGRWAEQFYFVDDGLDAVQSMGRVAQTDPMACLGCGHEFNSVPAPDQVHLILIEPAPEFRAGGHFLAHAICECCAAEKDETALYARVFAQLRMLGIEMRPIGQAGHA